MFNCPATFIFCFRDTNRDTLVSLRPETRVVATRVSGRKRVHGTELDIVNGTFCNLSVYVGYLAGVTYLRYTVLMSLKRGETAVAILVYRFLSCWCLETFFT